MIQVRNLKKSFGKKLIFENISMDLDYGHIYGFIGINGIGKSVFFQILSGLMKPTSGEVICNGKRLGYDIDYLENLGYMDNNAQFVKDLTGLQNLELLAAVNHKISKNMISEYMKVFGLDPNSKDKVKNYSLGMFQKLSIIQAIMEDPSIVILDEPFNGLDKTSCACVRSVILHLKEKNKMVLLTSHIMADIHEVADTLFEFDNKTVLKVKEEQAEQ